eukprot:TRINITY_DN1038_c0_g1_i1.p1 TRINITY_DN1038_c0_g1~~TRINITY_DN1038_c0_g1_i1.p1  ORF type:complete len:231 (+),score=34.01 TRINITY_DN1038_c0_g1_i1:117-809(+)
MLAIFQKSVAEGPAELLQAPETPRNARRGSRSNAVELLSKFKGENPAAVLLQFDDQHAIAYTPEQKRILTPRQFASVDDIFCAFSGTLENLPLLRQRYGLQRSISEVSFIIEAYKVLRDRAPYPAHQVVGDLRGSFAFVLYDHQMKKVFVAADYEGRIPLFWGKTEDDGVLAFSDDAAVLEAGCGSSFAPFPLGCYYSSQDGLHSFSHPKKAIFSVPIMDNGSELQGTEV